jgi:hypothetical protein
MIRLYTEDDAGVMRLLNMAVADYGRYEVRDKMQDY